MTDPAHEARHDALDARIEEAVADARAARHLAAAHDRDLADLGVKVDANRQAINALGVQTAARFERLEHELATGLASVRAEMRAGFEETRAGFAEMRAKFDQTAAGMERIVQLLTDR